MKRKRDNREIQNLRGELMEGKDFWKSKTFWANTIAIIASITGVFGLDLGLDPEAQTATVATIMGIVNLVLRFTTKEPIKQAVAK